MRRIWIGWTAVIILVSIVMLGRVGSLAVDWAWFSSVGYGSVFWTVLGAKAIVFAAVLGVTALLLSLNGLLALRFVSPRRSRLPAVFDQTFAALRQQPGPPPDMLQPRPRLPWRAVILGSAFVLAWPSAIATSSAKTSGAENHRPPRQPRPRLPWRAVILGSAFVLALLVAIAEIGKWDLSLRFIYQVPYGRTDPVFNNDIGFYLFSLPVYIALKNWMLLVLFAEPRVMAGAIYLSARADQSRSPAMAHLVSRRDRAWLRPAGSLISR